MAGTIFVGIMDNGSGDAIIGVMSADPLVALRRMQETFRTGYCNDDTELSVLSTVKDPAAPTLAEMDETLPGHGALIVEVPDGVELDEELRNWGFAPGTRLQHDDPRLGGQGKEER